MNYVWIPFIGLVLGVVVTFAFLLQVIHKFDSIIQLHSTISSYCSDPRGFGNRFLLCLTFIVGYNHINLLIQEQMILEEEAWNKIYFYLQLSADFLLPLVGVFYTSSHGMVNNVIYEMSPWIQFPVIYSEYIHSVCAIGWMFITVVLNLLYGIESNNVSYLIISTLSMIIFFMFIMIQGLIEFYGVEHQYVYECPDCENSFPLLTRLSPNQGLSDTTCRRCFREVGMNQNVITTFQEGRLPFQIDMHIQTANSSGRHWTFVESQYIKRSSHLFAWSFIFESVTVLSASVLAYTANVLRIQHGCGHA